jgi:hypothetical protein
MRRLGEATQSPLSEQLNAVEKVPEIIEVDDVYKLTRTAFANDRRGKRENWDFTS